MTYVKLEDVLAIVEKNAEGMSWSENPHESGAGFELMKRAQDLRSLPTDDGVTDEMVERAARALADNLSSGEISPCQWFIEGGLYSEEMLKEIARAVMKAALGPLPAPPTIE